MKIDQDALCPPEVELSKAVDYLEANCARIRDWKLVAETIERMTKFSPSVEFQKLASKPRVVAVDGEVST